MQTFLPYPHFKESARVLDSKRLGKQRTEALQILKVITNQPRPDGTSHRGWINHPCSIMWRPYPDALKFYANTMIEEWVRRGHKNTMELFVVPDRVQLPEWMGFDLFHASHRSNLIRKDAGFYNQFNWDETGDLPYVWQDEKNNWYEQYPGSGNKKYLLEK